jgi:autotransporter-associated beta strand protein
MKRYHSLIAASLTLAALVPLQTNAADNTWDNGSANFLWDLSSTNWTSPTIWADGSSAIFGATGVGTVTLGVPVSVQNQTFNVAGYTIAGGGNALTLVGTTPTITVNAATTNATSLYGTSGLTIQGTGVLSLEGDTGTVDANHYTGGTYVKGGTLILQAAGASSSGLAYAVDSIEALDAGAKVQLGSTFDGTTWSGPAQGQIGARVTGSKLHMTGGTFDLYNDPKNQVIPVPEGTGLIINTGPDVQAGVEVIADGLDHEFSGVIADGNNGVLIGDNSGQGPGYQIGIISFAGSINGGGGVWTLSGSNTYSGSTRIDQGASIKLAGNGTIGFPTPNGMTGPLRIYGSPDPTRGYLDLNGHNQTIALMQRGNADAKVFNSAVRTVSTLTFGYGNEQVARFCPFQFMDNQGTGGILALRKIGTNCIQTLYGTNTYSGDTTVSEGILAITEFDSANYPGLVLAVSPNSAYRLSTSAVLQLNYPGTANVRQLWINGVQQPNGVYGAGTPGIDPASTGTLTVTGYAPVALGVSQSGSTLTFTWQGVYKLQAKTNSIIGPWFDYPDGSTSPVVTTIDKTKGSVYFRLSTF